MRITIVGCGYVGTVTGICFADLGNEIIFYDIDTKKLDDLANGISPIYEIGLDDLISRNHERISTTDDLHSAVRNADITFVCVGTPSQQDGSIDLQYILNACNTIGDALKELDSFHPVIIKSTVFPGSTEGEIREALERGSGKRAYHDFGIGSNPEFLREGNAVLDFINPDRIVLGTRDEKTNNTLKKLYLSFTCPILETDIRTAEMIKYASNAFLATKISFANEIGNLSKKMGIDAAEVFAGVGLDHRIGSEFFRTGIGFGGSCFPKDVRALIAGADMFGERLGILREALRINDEQPLRMIELLHRHLPDLTGKKIGILGLAFKPDTDDIRESRAIPIIQTLLDEGADLIAFDPLAMKNFQQIIPGIEYASTAEEVLSADALLIITEWKEFFDLDFRGKIVIDGRRLPRAKEEAAIYEGVCW